MLLHERFNDKDAADLFKEALEKDPKNAQAYYGLALISANGSDDNGPQYAEEGDRTRPEARRCACAAGRVDARRTTTRRTR